MNLKDQVELLMQGTEYGDDDLAAYMADQLHKKLITSAKQKRPLRVYCGYDPTSSDLHLGHTITMRKLRQFQELGHEVTFLIGSYTALVGDPSDKNKARPVLSQEQVAENANTYAEQAYRILDKEKTIIRYNGEWLSELSLVDLIRLGQNFTVQQFLARENFSKRIQANEPIYLHETFYALMQGYDAVAMETDIQVGGTDQLFNIVVAGRKLQEALGQEPLVGIICGILPGTDGVQRMSKTTGNVIPINTDPIDMYGKIMSVPDEAMIKYYRLATRYGPSEIDKIDKEISIGKIHPRDAKMKLAFEITSIFYGKEQASEGEKTFIDLFQKGKQPDEIIEFQLKPGETILELISRSKLVASKSEGRRLIKQNGIRLEGKVISDSQFKPIGGVLQVGKRKFIRLVN
ncbi:tyrosine--tRNA ligase [Chloroflexota bacterium]